LKSARFLTLALLSSVVHADPELILSTTSIEPGQTLRVEVDGLPPTEKLRASFRGKSYPLYVVGPSAQRALIGIELGAKPQEVQLKIVRAAEPKKELMILAPVAVTIASRTYQQDQVNFSAKKTPLMKLEAQESAIIGRHKKYLTARQLWEGAFMVPVEGPESTAYGVERIRNKKIRAGFHKGVDIKAKTGTPIRCPANGVVLLATPFKAHGGTVMINHGQGVQTIFLHMSKIFVKPGATVKKGQIIGHVGSTGLSTAPHLHWQVFVHGVPVDPHQWENVEF